MILFDNNGKIGFNKACRWICMYLDTDKCGLQFSSWECQDMVNFSPESILAIFQVRFKALLKKAVIYL